MADMWLDEDNYWRENFRSRPYFGQGTTYESLSGGYRYGYDAAYRYPGRTWDDIASDLERDWDRYEHRGPSTWQQVKDAVRDAWDRVTGRQART
jgi:hypothetical protein